MASFDQLLVAPPDPAGLERVLFDEAEWSIGVNAGDTGAEAPSLRAQIDQSGVGRAGVVVDETARLVCLDLIRQVRKRGWPPIFAALHPAFFQLLASPALLRALGTLFDEPVLCPRLWLTHVAPVAGASGWRPHLDAHTPQDNSRLTVFLALTEASVDNGCIHVLPRDIAGEFPRDLLTAPTLDAGRVMSLLHHSRALPAHAGELWVWSKNILHWGGVSTGEAAGPRVSITTEFGARAARFSRAEGPAIDLRAGVPAFSARLRLVGTQLLKYVEYESEEAVLAPFLPLAERMRGVG